ncbi:MAG: TIM barrel protein [Verrucomicrobiota bacterium]
MKRITRRSFLHSTLAASLFTSMQGVTIAAVGKAPSLAFGTYGLPGYSLQDAIKLVSSAGFDSIEFVAMPGYHGAPDQVPQADRAEIRQMLIDSNLTPCALMGLPNPDASKQPENDAWVTQTIELALDLAPKNPPIIQSVLGGGEWEDKKSLFRDTLGPWVATASQAGVPLAIKPHRNQAMSLPEQGAWLIEQLDAKEHLKLVYDQSHFAFRNLPIAKTVAEALPYTGYIMIKDVVMENGKPRFRLPGETDSIPHAEVLRHFIDGGYQGQVCCEVSSQIWRSEDYDPSHAVKICFANLQDIMNAVEAKS